MPVVLGFRMDIARQQLFRFNSYTTTMCNTRTAFSIHMAAGPFQHTPRGCCTHSISNEALPCRVGFEAFSILRFHNLSLISNFNPIVHYAFRSLQKKRCIKTKKRVHLRFKHHIPSQSARDMFSEVTRSILKRNEILTVLLVNGKSLFYLSGQWVKFMFSPQI